MTDVKSSAITAFFGKERAKMTNFIRKRLADGADRDAEDIIQDVMVKLFESVDLNVPLEKLSSYIYTALRNRIIDMMRSRRSDLSLDEIDEEQELSLASVMDNPAGGKEYYEEVYRALDSLESSEREIIIATEFEDFSFKELSREWDEPIGTLLSRKARALEKIRKILSKGGDKK